MLIKLGQLSEEKKDKWLCKFAFYANLKVINWM